MTLGSKGWAKEGDEEESGWMKKMERSRKESVEKGVREARRRASELKVM